MWPLLALLAQGVCLVLELVIQARASKIRNETLEWLDRGAKLHKEAGELLAEAQRVTEAAHPPAPLH